jgi:hypothetical protein
MTQPRRRPNWTLVLAGVLLLASAAGHGIAGWAALRAELAAASVPADLAGGIGAGWQFGTAAFLAFGVVAFFAGLSAGRASSHLYVALLPIAAACAGFGAVYLVARAELFFLLFVVLGALVGAGAAGELRAAVRTNGATGSPGRAVR